MLIGSGLIATAFQKYQSEDVVLFASGVSNSLEKRVKSFDRERALLEHTCYKNQHSLIVYFSTCSIAELELNKSPYITHKLKMESLIKKQCDNYMIFRLPQVVGKTANPHALVNFLYNSILEGKRFDIWQYACRNLIDISDVYVLADYFIQHEIYKNEVITIASPVTIKVLGLVRILEQLIGKSAHFDILKSGTCYDIDISHLIPYIKLLNMSFPSNYPEIIIYKYYGK